MQSKTDTRYGVARGEKLVHEELFIDVVSAKNHLQRVSEQMESIGLEPDVRLVEVEVKTSYGRPKAYKEPSDEVAEDAPADEQAEAPAE